ncbi:DUF4190 domain-containing protein [Leifsonia sp. 2MCAF36]|uniref:DUF4190 domain-containing protein n=1 Tax=Leifsonia sp. 2MCAF36 TaxID=3232988 RepID=UPI003F9A5DCB
MVPDVIPPSGGIPEAPPPDPWTRVDPGVQPYPFAPPYAPEPSWNVLAIVGFVGSFWAGLIGIVCGHIALAQIRRTGEKGRGLALAGTIIGYAQFALIGLWIAVVIVFSVIGGVAQSSAASSADTQMASPTADCATIEKASLTLSSALTDIATSSWKDTPAAAKSKVVVASTRFTDETQSISDDTLVQGINAEQNDLALLSSALVDYEAAAPGQGDATKVTAAVTQTSDDLTRLTSTCG